MVRGVTRSARAASSSDTPAPCRRSWSLRPRIMRSTVGALALPAFERPSLTPYLLRVCHPDECDRHLLKQPDRYRHSEIIRESVAA
ncbi:hypothetical protein GCM10011578_079710 [Streptomyces fuscichromogenes]|uniref:Uncharacterized protein n=1 Tax=Streptomyces fuscichromogenes TaxID=1324013 RepID=A0A917XKX8_9ACTN|nr:hypothetical protein GCM10011578_079710 [Streptomyces fuscichromogenes]